MTSTNEEARRDVDPFWDREEIVDRFAGRDPDLRLRRIIEEEPISDVGSLRILDLGSAGGRNTLYLAERGVDVHAVDASEAMVERTRYRVAEVLGRGEAERRVRRGWMNDLPYPANDFDVVVALGVIQTATTLEEWKRAVSELRRVLRPGGRVLVSNFSSESQPQGRALDPLEGADHTYRWRGDRPMVLMGAGDHDAFFAAQGFEPVVATTVVRVPMDAGFRVTLNAMYR